MTTLLIDTCLGACQVALARDGQVFAALSEPMERGHQERLAPMAAEVMREGAIAFADLSQIAVTVGPGSFTGLRVGVAFASGLRLATGAPAVGVGTLEALAAGAGDLGLTAGIIDARRGQVYLQVFRDGRPLAPAHALSVTDAVAELEGLCAAVAVRGPGASLLQPLNAVTAAEIIAPDLAVIARLVHAGRGDSALKPLYVRAPDAKLAAK